MQAQQASASPEQRNAIKFLRSKASLKIRKGVLNGGRVEYFKGSGAIKAVRSDAYTKLANAGSVPKLPTDDEEAARTLLHTLLPTAHFLRVDRGGVMGPAQTGGAAAPAPSGPVKPADQVRIVSIAQQQMFVPDGYYVWLWNGPQWGVYLGGIGLVAVVLAGVMFPLWPPFMRLGTWYLSIGVLGLIGLFFALAIFRLIFYVITIFVAKPGIWIYPALFDDVGFFDSFRPVWAWVEEPKKKSRKAKSASGEAKASGKSKRLRAPVDGSAAGSGASSRAATPVPAS